MLIETRRNSTSGFVCGVSELKILLIEMRNDRGEDAIDCVKDIREGTFLMLTLIACAAVHL